MIEMTLKIPSQAMPMINLKKDQAQMVRVNIIKHNDIMTFFPSSFGKSTAVTLILIVHTYPYLKLAKFFHNERLSSDRFLHCYFQRIRVKAINS